MFIAHGYPKLAGGPDTWVRIGGAMKNAGIEAFPVFWGFLASFAEGVGGLLLASGLFTRPVAFLKFFKMFIDALTHYVREDGFGGYSHPLELAFVFLFFLFAGPGKYSLDQRWFRQGA